MSVILEKAPDQRLVEICLSGCVDEVHYEQFVRALERMVGRRDSVRLLVEMTDLHGRTAGALWTDFKFDARPFSILDQLAIVGER